jgi:hypothetical protein
MTGDPEGPVKKRLTAQVLEGWVSSLQLMYVR